MKEFENIGYTWLLVVSRKMEEHELWSFSNALFFIILIILLAIGVSAGFSVIFDIKKIKNDWTNQRCSPMIMPFASFFGHNTKDNFEFCMGKTFSIYSGSYLGSIGTIFSSFSALLQSIFNSLNSMRNVIASLGGGINIIFQEFTERISTFFFKLRLSGIHMKSLFIRLYAILFSVMYMGMSGITGMTSFTNTFLFSFLDTFCFPGETPIHLNHNGTLITKSIKEIQIGDILWPHHEVTATFKFYSRGQPMVKLGDVVVSTNHYVMYQGKPIKAGQHPHAISDGPWNKDDLLYCLNTNTHFIPVSHFTFLDYDETPSGDKDTMNFIENRINSTNNKKDYSFTEYGFGIGEETRIKTLTGLIQAKDITIGTQLSTGSKIAGIIRKQFKEICNLDDSTSITPSTLYWNTNHWSRIGNTHTFSNEHSSELLSFVVVPNSQIELENGMIVRDYMEICSPDSETYYSSYLESDYQKN